ncbi:MAG TPA: 6-bladed beta-propeller [Longimicrobium sp.]|nr:6-bladed beta-propeller [Longimicrobium sp.]
MDVLEAANGHVYVLDFGDRTIKEFSPDGTFLRSYGKGKGRGPGELLNPTDFQVTTGGEVWVLDPAQGRIQVFDARGEPVRTLRVEVPANRFALYSDGSYVLLGKSEWLLYHFTTTGVPAGGFGRLVADQDRNTVALQGEISLLPDGDILYGPMRGGYLARFARSGALVYYRESVDPKPYPDLKFYRGGGSTVKRDARQALSTIGMGVDGEEVWVLTVAEVDGHPRGAVDVYATSGGTYRYSFVSPQGSAANVHLTRRHLYVVGDTVVTRWTRRR